ncbi:MAG: hypothetical protein R2939_04285 [Kofleriaceae bacterium]
MLTTSAAHALVASFLDRARLRGERAVALTRVVIASLAAVQTVVLAQVGPGMHARQWGTLGVCALAVAASVYISRRVRTDDRHASLLWVSVAMDAALIGAALGLVMSDPSPGVPGFLRSRSWRCW